MGKTYKDTKNYNPSSRPKNKKSQKNSRIKLKEYERLEEGNPETN